MLRGGGPRGGGSLIFPKVPQSSLGILRVPQLPLPLNTPPLRTLQLIAGKFNRFGHIWMNQQWMTSFWWMNRIHSVDESTNLNGQNWGSPCLLFKNKHLLKTPPKLEKKQRSERESDLFCQQLLFFFVWLHSWSWSLQCPQPCYLESWYIFPMGNSGFSPLVQAIVWVTNWFTIDQTAGTWISNIRESKISYQSSILKGPQPLVFLDLRQLIGNIYLHDMLIC